MKSLLLPPIVRIGGRGPGVVHIEKETLRELMATTFFDRALRVSNIRAHGLGFRHGHTA